VSKVFVVLLAALLLASCSASVGKKFDTSKVSLIQKGVTTQDEILKMFGKPNQKGFKEGKEVWGYSHYSGGYFGGSSTKQLEIVFDDNKVVYDYTYAEGKY
jgi:outer membrane protein assembly factor BamE (lipoprotein component of BamABCDE complex)